MGTELQVGLECFGPLTCESSFAMQYGPLSRALYLQLRKRL